MLEDGNMIVIYLIVLRVDNMQLRVVALIRNPVQPPTAKTTLHVKIVEKPKYFAELKPDKFIFDVFF